MVANPRGTECHCHIES